MREVLYHRNAVRYLRRMPPDRKDQVKGAIDQLASSEDPAMHPNVKAMAGDWNGCHRLRIGQYRAVLRLVAVDGHETLQVLQVGPRGNVY
jgi:mRNA-degrading endonuclease RelE of RelBE toxin-antitoxin system